ncbi:30S ribosomal protein S8e [Candidatus Micrarchaeota archaeon]|nr:30S ribosomal protein S8e [Candidatus Micrarchaeota archaeon]
MSEQFHGRSDRKSNGSGAKILKFRDKRLSELGGHFTATKIDEKERKTISRGRGGTIKVKLKRTSYVNVVTKQGVKKAKIKTVVESPNNRHYTRANILTKGIIIDTDAGKVRITNRVGQDGVVNGVLV